MYRVLETLDDLNEEQKQAVTAKGKHLLVIAGPGTGKTLTVVRRIAYLLRQGMPPYEIIAVTFTNRAAREMRERLQTYLNEEVGGMFIGTFHVLGLRIMKESPGEPFFSVCTREEQLDILKSIVGGSTKAQAAVEEISRIKNCIGEFDPCMQSVCDAYETALRRKGMRDFDDLILVPIELFETNRTADWCRDTPRCIIVDEYQDISPSQYRLLKCLVGAHPRNTLCAVGDSDQAIYAFRGADVQNFLSFANDFPGAATVVLRENFRSTRTVLDAADGLIKNNLRRVAKGLDARREEGPPIRNILFSDEGDEAEFIVREIEFRIGGTSNFRIAGDKRSRDFKETSCAFSDFGVLFRTNAQAEVLRQAFDRWGIPCQVVGEQHAFQKKMLIESLRAHLETVQDGMNIPDLLKRSADETGATAADQILLDTIAAAHTSLPFRNALTEIINELTLLNSIDTLDPRADAVVLMTMHMAKGLEFQVVFIAGCEDGLIPFTFTKGDTDIEEERRLFYVAMTRAKGELFLLHARSRFLYGRKMCGAPSPFLAEIPQQFVRTESIEKPTKPKTPKQPSLF